MLSKSKKIATGGIVIILIIAIASIIVFHKPQPTHNPFDNVFNVSIDKLKEQGYVFQYGTCGYNSYDKSINGIEIFYQEYDQQPGDIVAKGAYIPLDTLCKECLYNTKIIEDTTRPGLAPLTEGEYQCAAIRDSLYLKHKVEISSVNERLKAFEVSVIDTSFKLTEYGYNFYVKHSLTDSIFFCEITIGLDCIRTINMFQANPQPFSEKPIFKFFSNLFKKEQDESEEELINEYAEE